MRTSLVLAVWCLAWSASAQGQPAPFMMLTHIGDEQLEGQPLAWDNNVMLLMGRDGQLHEFAPQAAKQSKKTSSTFRGYSIMEMRDRLRNEFPKSFDITYSQHFVVAHPRGEWSVWADRLEGLFRSFNHYMSVRGFDLREPAVPLVAVVFRNQGDYYQYAKAHGMDLQPNTLGHYAPTTNRIYMYDAGLEEGRDWTTSIDTIIHEAAHQTAYNVGIHRRFAEQPRWLVEGLAMMFEARGLWDARSTHTRKDRINRGRLADFRALLNEGVAEDLRRLIASDNKFRTEPATAYAEAWALSFFLCETRPQAYCDYLAHVGSRKAFTRYPAKQRMADFTRYFGDNIKQLNAEMVRFFSELN